MPQDICQVSISSYNSRTTESWKHFFMRQVGRWTKRTMMVGYIESWLHADVVLDTSVVSMCVKCDNWMLHNWKPCVKRSPHSLQQAIAEKCEPSNFLVYNFYATLSCRLTDP